MIYTASDLTAVQNAIIELSTGKRVSKITFSHGETVEYGLVRLDELKRLRSEIQSELDSAAGKQGFVRTITGKGL